jgi:hypothetical protein
MAYKLGVSVECSVRISVVNQYVDLTEYYMKIFVIYNWSPVVYKSTSPWIRLKNVSHINFFLKARYKIKKY